VKPDPVRLCLRIVTHALRVLHLDLEIVFRSSDRHGGDIREPATLLLSITVSTNSLNVAANTLSPTTTALDNPGAEESSTRPGDLPTRGNTPVGPVPDGQVEMSRTLDRAEKAMKAMDSMMAWKGAINVIKQVLDAIGPVAGVCLTSILRIICSAKQGFALPLLPHAQLAWTLLSKIPEVRPPTLVGGHGTFNGFHVSPDFATPASA
jgi:hypothetical protein